MKGLFDALIYLSVKQGDKIRETNICDSLDFAKQQHHETRGSTVLGLFVSS